MGKFDFKKALKGVNDKAFSKAKAEAESSGRSIPSGEIVIFRAGDWSVGESDNGRPQITATMTVIDGDYTGASFFYKGGIDEQGLSFTLRDLNRLGIDVSAIDTKDDLASALEALAETDCVFRGKLIDSKSNPDFQNLRIQRLLDGGEYAAAGDTNSGTEETPAGTDADVPFNVGDEVVCGDAAIAGTVKEVDTEDSTVLVKIAETGKAKSFHFYEVQKAEPTEEPTEGGGDAVEFSVGDDVTCGDNDLAGQIKSINADDSTAKVVMTEGGKVKTFAFDDMKKAEETPAEIEFSVGDEVSFKLGKKTVSGTITSLPKGKGRDGSALIKVKGEAKPTSVKISDLTAA